MQPVNANPFNDQVERVYFEIDEDKLDQWEKPQIKESKKAFFYATISDGGDKEKMECFVDFCEDAIFEMQHSASLIETDDTEGKVMFVSPESLPSPAILLLLDCPQQGPHHAEGRRAPGYHRSSEGEGGSGGERSLPGQHHEADHQDEGDATP